MAQVVGILFALLVAASPASAADANVRGDWRVSFSVPRGIESCTLVIQQQRDGKIAGTVVSEDGEFPLKGTIAGDDLTVVWSVPEQGDQLEITVKAKVRGDTINGTARLGTLGEGSLSGQRTSRVE
jgi:hypothetical protein